MTDPHLLETINLPRHRSSSGHINFLQPRGRPRHTIRIFIEHHLKEHLGASDTELSNMLKAYGLKATPDKIEQTRKNAKKKQQKQPKQKKTPQKWLSRPFCGRVSCLVRGNVLGFVGRLEKVVHEEPKQCYVIEESCYHEASEKIYAEHARVTEERIRELEKQI